MMKKLLGMVAVAALLAACADEVEETNDVVDPGTGQPTGAASLIDGDINAATFNGATETMIVSITLDADVENQVYTRAVIYDVNGYQAYTTQDDPLDRMFTAFGGVSADGVTTAVVAMDGGQFTKYFGGAVYNATSYSAPSAGLSSYAGKYVGLTNVGTRDGTLDSIAPAVLLPERAARIQGDVFINADFTDNQLNGAIYNREVLDGSPLNVGDGTVYLTPTGIAADGSFTGTAAQSIGGAAPVPVGEFTGTFGGANASGLAGGIYITDFDPDLDNEEERGIFVLNQCGTAGESADCGTFNVDDLNSN